jgi:CBS domain-containing protein
MQRAGDVMVRDVICVQKEMDLRDLAKLFVEKSITGAPVVDERGNLVGVISQRDVMFYNLERGDELVLDSDFYHRVKVEGRHLPAGYQIEDTNSGRVNDVMTPVVHSVLESATLDAVARMMTRKHIHRVIVRSGKKVAGIISALDVLAACAGAIATSKPSKTTKNKKTATAARSNGSRRAATTSARSRKAAVRR